MPAVIRLLTVLDGELGAVSDDGDVYFFRLGGRMLVLGSGFMAGRHRLHTVPCRPAEALLDARAQPCPPMSDFGTDGAARYLRRGSVVVMVMAAPSTFFRLVPYGCRLSVRGMGPAR